MNKGLLYEIHFSIALFTHLTSYIYINVLLLTVISSCMYKSFIVEKYMSFIVFCVET
jgi:hypothetical protein